MWPHPTYSILSSTCKGDIRKRISGTVSLETQVFFIWSLSGQNPEELPNEKNWTSQTQGAFTQTGHDLFLEAFIALLSFPGLSGASGPCFKKTSSLRTKNLSIGYVSEVGKFYLPHANFQWHLIDDIFYVCARVSIYLNNMYTHMAISN